MNKKYKYKVNDFNFRRDSLSKDYKTFAEKMNELQGNGWEFVSVLSRDRSYFSYLIKKPLDLSLVDKIEEKEK